MSTCVSWTSVWLRPEALHWLFRHSDIVRIKVVLEGDSDLTGKALVTLSGDDLLPIFDLFLEVLQEVQSV